LPKSTRFPLTPLRLFRRANNLSQEAAAKLVHCRQSTWNRVELGQTAPRPELAQNIMQLTKLPLTSILMTYRPKKKKKGRAA
jgi:transcriptional regulator with XRE-family HTH domain